MKLKPATLEGRIFLAMTFTATVLVGAALAQSVRLRAKAQHDPAPVSLRGDERLLTVGRSADTGNPAAAATLVIFTDYQCPACKELDAGLPDLINRHRADL